MKINNYLKRWEKAKRNLNFNRILNCMTAMDWKWQDKVPTLEEIEKQAKELFIQGCEIAEHSNTFDIEAGGFHVTSSGDKSNNTVRIAFEITSVQSTKL